MLWVDISIDFMGTESRSLFLLIPSDSDGWYGDYDKVLFYLEDTNIWAVVNTGCRPA